MATFNGEKFLVEQLESLSSQTFKNWRLYVSDDGSSDGTLAILKRYQELWGPDKLIVRNGPQKGFAQNFLSLACDKNIKSDFYAFCDQDDVWMPEKLRVSIEHIHSVCSAQQVYAYSSRTIYVDENLKFIGYSPLFVFPRTFRNALIQSIAGGNTMVFNQATKNLLQKMGVVPTVAHDWWLYQIVTGSGGTFFYDKVPLILYRQHRSSIVGSNQSLSANFTRFIKVLNGSYKLWIDKNISCLRKNEIYLISANIEILNIFEIMRKASLKDRFRLLEVCGLYRQTWKGSLAFFMFILFNKV